MSNVSDWAISSVLWTSQTATWGGTPAAVTASAGALYLLHTSAALDLCARVVAAMTTAGIAAPACFVTEDRHVRLESSGAFAVVWGAATLLRDTLGFAGDLGSATTHTATLRSPLLWSPAKRFSPGRSPLGSHGQPVADVSISLGPRGIAFVRQEGAATVVQTFAVQHVPKERYFATSPNTVAGEFASWWETELLTAAKWVVRLGVTEGSSASASATYGSALQIGPYVADVGDANMRRRQFTRSSGFGRTEAYYDLTIEAIVTEEHAA